MILTPHERIIPQQRQRAQTGPPDDVADHPIMLTS